MVYPLAGDVLATQSGAVGNAAVVMIVLLLLQPDGEPTAFLGTT